MSILHNVAWKVASGMGWAYWGLDKFQSWLSNAQERMMKFADTPRRERLKTITRLMELERAHKGGRL